LTARILKGRGPKVDLNLQAFQRVRKIQRLRRNRNLWVFRKVRMHRRVRKNRRKLGICGGRCKGISREAAEASRAQQKVELIKPVALEPLPRAWKLSKTKFENVWPTPKQISPLSRVVDKEVVQVPAGVSKSMTSEQDFTLTPVLLANRPLGRQPRVYCRVAPFRMPKLCVTMRATRIN